MSNSFSKLGIASPLLTSLAQLQITEPTEIQQKAIPILLNNTVDFIGVAKTGTGKTAAFGLPILQLISVKNPSIQAVIVVPTRELGKQIKSNLTEFSKNIPEIRIVEICGGAPIKPQIEQLKNPTHLVIATPGRLIDLIKRDAINIKTATYLVLDEADEMITILKDSLDEIVAEMPKNKRTFLFTATLPGSIKQLIQNYLSKNNLEVQVDMKSVGNTAIIHEYSIVEPIEKLNVLLHFLSSMEGKRGIIFCKTKAAVNKLAKNLAINRFSSGALHGSLTQPIRDRIMGQFREGNINIIVATDLVSRGIDVQEIEFVVNYHLPDTPEAYVHRSGRTARAGAAGYSLSILQQEELVELNQYEKDLGLNFSVYKKPNSISIEENNLYLWSKQIFKTKPNQSITSEVKDKIKTVFHHLTKEELIEKLISNQYQHTKINYNNK